MKSSLLYLYSKVMNNGSWTREFIIESVCGVERPLGLWGNNELFFEGSNHELMLYDRATGELKNLGIFDHWKTMRLFPYVGSLVPLNGKAELEEHLTHQPNIKNKEVSRGSDVVFVGQQIFLMCIGQDVRGNIKLSRKVTLPQPRSTTKNVANGSAPVSNETHNIWASLEKVSNREQKKSTPEELSLSENESTASDPSASSTLAVII
ncbi:hypothetical protein PTKIN_Ptkin07bG0057100 [Pterospermum kingtungense]